MFLFSIFYVESKTAPFPLASRLLASDLTQLRLRIAQTQEAGWLRTERKGLGLNASSMEAFFQRTVQTHTLELTTVVPAWMFTCKQLTRAMGRHRQSNPPPSKQTASLWTCALSSVNIGEHGCGKRAISGVMLGMLMQHGTANSIHYLYHSDVQMLDSWFYDLLNLLTK